MRRSGGLAALGVAAMALCAGQSGPNPQTNVTVCMQVSGDVEIVNWAKLQATRMFLPIGVKLTWRSDSRLCHDSPDRAVVVTLLHETPADRPPGALARSFPFEGVHVEVYCDRILGAPESTRKLLLAHVLVHEITHLLQGCDHHSASGVMKARWDTGDFAQMRRQSLRFSPADVALLRQGLAARNAQAPRALLAAAE